MALRFFPKTQKSTLRQLILDLNGSYLLSKPQKLHFGCSQRICPGWLNRRGTSCKYLSPILAIHFLHSAHCVGTRYPSRALYLMYNHNQPTNKPTFSVVVTWGPSPVNRSQTEPLPTRLGVVIGFVLFVNCHRFLLGCHRFGERFTFGKQVVTSV